MKEGLNIPDGKKNFMKNIFLREMTIRDYEQVLALWKRTSGLGLSGVDSKEGIRAFLERNWVFALFAKKMKKSSAQFSAGMMDAGEYLSSCCR